MSVDEIKRINELIEKAQIESAKSKGVIEQIEKDWKNKYGTSDLDEIISIRDKLESELEEKNEESEKLYDELMNGYDWDKLEEELNEV